MRHESPFPAEAKHSDLEAMVLERTAELNDANNLLQKGKDLLQSIIDNTSATIYMKDTEGKFMLVNKRLEELFHISRKELIGKTDYDILPKEMADAFRENDRKVFEAGRPIEFEESALHNDGLLHTYISLKFPLLDSDGRPHAVCGISTDITERKQMEKKLKKYNETLEFEVKERSAELEKFGNRLYKLYEISFMPMIGAKDLARLILEETINMLYVDMAGVGQAIGDKWTAYAVVDRAFGTREAATFPLVETLCGVVCEREAPLVIRNSDESEGFKDHIDVKRFGVKSYLGVPLFAGGELFGTLFTASKSPHDYTDYDLIIHQLLAKRLEFEFVMQKYKKELKLSALQAQAANRAKSEFLMNMSHELRTPLNAVIGFSALMKDGMAGVLSDEQKGFATDIYESGQHLLRLISDILELSKFDLEEEMLELTEFPVDVFLKESIAVFREKALKQNIKLAAEIKEDIGSIEADAIKLKQTMLQLLSNAIKFTPDGGSVSVQARKVSSAKFQVASEDLRPETIDLQLNGNFLEISVSDTGIGIKEEDMERLFRPFEQLEAPLTKKHEGTGLGLILCKRFVEVHKGSIRAESEPGKGCRFAFVIPVRQT